MAESAVTLARRRVALNARLIRARLGWTQEQAVEKIDCSVQALRRIEGARAHVSLDLLATIAKAYGVDLAQLFAESGPWKAPLAGRPSSRRASRKSTRRT